MSDLFARTGLISADSHVVEPPDLFQAAFPLTRRATAPRVEAADGGHRWVFPGTSFTAELGFMAGAGLAREALRPRISLADLPADLFDARRRLAAQDRDGVEAEVLFPTVGLVTLWHPDDTTRDFCARAYTEWVIDFASVAPDRLVPVAVSAASDPARAAEDLGRYAGAGARALLLPTRPPGGAVGYHDRAWDALWEAAAATGTPIAFHAHTEPTPAPLASSLEVYATGIRSCQEVLAVLTLGGVLDRHPGLLVLIAEADAGWVPHFLQRLDRAWLLHREALGGSELSQPPGDLARRGVRHTLQDDAFALASIDWFAPEQLLWASDYPHADSTWPESAAVLARIGTGLDAAQWRAFTRGNAAAVFGIPH